MCHRPLRKAIVPMRCCCCHKAVTVENGAQVGMSKPWLTMCKMVDWRTGSVNNRSRDDWILLKAVTQASRRVVEGQVNRWRSHSIIVGQQQHVSGIWLS